MGYEINAYAILGLADGATEQEVEDAYDRLRKQYEDDRFAPGEKGEEAAEKLEQIKVAYQDLKQKFQDVQNQADSDENNKTIQTLIQDGKLDEAQARLDESNNRDAEWHFLQSVVFFKKNWYLESKRQLEIALSMDPQNERYKQSLAKLKQVISSNTISPDQLRTTSQQTGGSTGNMGAGNGTCTGSMCADCLLANACCNCARCGMGC